MTDNNARWVRAIIIVLVAEKIIQHIAVTTALSFNWMNIGATVAVPPAILIVLGGLAAILFAAALWGIVKRQAWATNLIIGLALFDMIGEFVAQGTIGIQLNVSFLVATTLLVCCLIERRQAIQRA